MTAAKRIDLLYRPTHGLGAAPASVPDTTTLPVIPPLYNRSMAGDRPLCFVLMPVGSPQERVSGDGIDFDRVYGEAVAPAVDGAGMTPVRAGTDGSTSFERMLLCDYAVADLTGAAARTGYELGMRAVVRPESTQAIVASSTPADVDFLPVLVYRADDCAGLRSDLAARLEALRAGGGRDPLSRNAALQLVEGWRTSDVARLKTDLFRARADYDGALKARLKQARASGDAGSVAAVERDLGALDAVELGVLVDLLLSYRALSAWSNMVDLCDRLPLTLRATVMVREQLAFAHSRLGRRDEAERMLTTLIAQCGASSENCSLLGRVYKDRWREADAAGDLALARHYLQQAIAAYERGYEADIRDAFPGVNAVTLLEIEGGGAALARQQRLLPAVRLAVSMRLNGDPDYWDHATLTELAVLAGDVDAAREHLEGALAAVREPWEPRTTAGNLHLIHSARTERGMSEPWLEAFIAQLERAAAAD